LTRPRLRPLEKAAYAFGGTVDIFGHWLYFGLMQPVFVGFLHLSPSLLGLTQATARLTDAFADSYFGWRSDNTRTRWGRRRPYVLVGSLLAGAALPCLFAASRTWSVSTLFWFVLLTACGYAPILSCYNMPYQSLGAELTAEDIRQMGRKALPVQADVGLLQAEDQPAVGHALLAAEILEIGDGEESNVAGVIPLVALPAIRARRPAFLG